MSNEMRLKIIASLLRRGQILDIFATGLTLLGILLGLGQMFIASPQPLPSTVAASLFILGVAQKYYALRVAFDADLFESMARHSEQIPERTVALDAALIALSVLPEDKAGRSWALRCQGALKLLRLQLAYLCLQLLVTIVGLSFVLWLSFVR